MDGESIIPLLRGETPKPRTLFWHFPNYTNQGGRPAGAVIDGQWKLVEQYEDGRRELYNLKEDVTESNDVSSVESERVKAMGDQLHDWLTRVGAQIPVKNPDFEPKKHAELYVTQDPSKLKPEATAAATEPKWKAWRTAMNDAVKGNKPKVTPATGDIRLQAKDARVHGEKLRYEPPSNKNVLGYWTNPQDWADWEFEVKTAGEYEVEVQQGCGKGNGGAEVDVVVDEQKLSFKVVDTGHFQHMIQITIGKVKLQPGKHQLAIRPRNKPGVAVMDVRRVVLRPVE